MVALETFPSTPPKILTLEPVRAALQPSNVKYRFRTSTPDGHYHPFVYSGGQMTALGTPGGQPHNVAHGQ
jgi:hypothetical protein